MDKLFSGFSGATTEAWEKIIEKDLKGADYDKKLIWKTNEGIKVKPYYRSEDLNGIKHLNFSPGQSPFARGNSTSSNNWLTRQDIVVENVNDANKKALFVLDRGVDSLGFILTKFLSVKELNILLNKVLVEAIEVNFICATMFEEVLQNFITVLKGRKVSLNEVKGSITYNPLTEMTLTGKIGNLSNAVKLIELSNDLPLFRTLIVHGSIFHNSGATAVEELGFSLATAAEYLDQLTEKDLSIDTIAPKMRFDFAVGSNYFMEIAKIRAARLLWAKMVDAYNPKQNKSTQMFLHSTTSSWNKTIYDPYVNMLRTTTEAMSSAIGGTDSLTVNAFDESYEIPTEFGERIARNQQLLLKEESYLDKVVDPAAGSYYIENLTNSIAEEAWKLFLETEELGGFTSSMKKGFIQHRIKATAKKRDHDIAHRREIFLGLNQYPDFNEKIEIELEEDILKASDLTVKKAKFETLKPYRGAQAFEALRYKTDQFAQNNKRPLVFMLKYGNVDMRKARAAFSSNFFACAGFDVMDNNGFESAEEGVKAAQESGADIIVICSSDDVYPEIASKIKQLAGETILVIAGYPKATMDDLKSKGIENFIHMKSNVLETLKDFQKQLGII
ncbi:MAG: methylmalonyl-CoA mutase small subunit [Bacteroidetes bacterium]|nr:methylmalonyl-CoA mutase small subunit [Bacteroidota bacterium]